MQLLYSNAAVAQCIREQLMLALWVGLSSLVILLNKAILDGSAAFPFPISLTMWHQICCALTGTIVIKLRLLGMRPVEGVTPKVYIRRVVPIGILYALTLASGNGAYLYLSVSFIQMLKASSPVIVYFVSVFATLESFSWSRLLNMVVISIGISIASYGEINLNVMGVSLQLLSIIAEAARIVLIQILLQRQGLKLNPLSTMYYVAPACIVCLLPAALVLELPALRQKLARDDPLPSVSMFALNGIGAVTLNLTVYLVLGQMPALMMNAAGVVKDWLLIYLSRLLFASPITKVQLCGYTLAFLGVAVYNYTRELEKRKEQQQQQQASMQLHQDRTDPDGESKQNKTSTT